MTTPYMIIENGGRPANSMVVKTKNCVPFEVQYYSSRAWE